MKEPGTSIVPPSLSSIFGRFASPSFFRSCSAHGVGFGMGEDPGPTDLTWYSWVQA